MGDRSRLREGRPVFYYPTSAEATSQGDGPWAARIVDVNADGTVDLITFPPAIPTALPAAVADPLITTADAAGAAYDAAEETLLNELKADVNTLASLVNALRGELAGYRKNSVVVGGLAGQCSLEGRSDL